MSFDSKITSNTLVDYPRLERLKIYLQFTSNLNGCVAEVGVYKGGTARLLCLHTDKRVLLFDTFSGMPQVNPGLDLHNTGDFADTSISHVTSVLESCANFALYRGVFPKANAEYAEHLKFSFVHLDVDIHDSVKECLEFFVPRMVPGGIIVLDDYLEPNCPGAKLAADEFFANRSEKVVATVQSQAMIQF